MVEQMVNSKLNKYGMGKYGGLLATSDKQPSVSIKNTALQDLQNDNRTVLSRTIGNFTSLRETKSEGNANQASGSSILTRDCLSKLPLQPPAGSNVNPHQVYARRKSEADTNKCSIPDKKLKPDYPKSEQFKDKWDLPQPQVKNMEPKTDAVSALEQCRNKQDIPQPEAKTRDPKTDAISALEQLREKQDNPQPQAKTREPKTEAVSAREQFSDKQDISLQQAKSRETMTDSVTALGLFSNERDTPQPEAKAREPKASVVSAFEQLSERWDISQPQVKIMEPKTDVKSATEQSGDKRDIPQPQAKTREPKTDAVSTFTPFTEDSFVTLSAGLLPNTVQKIDNGHIAGVDFSLSCSEDSQFIRDQHWRESFIKLQQYLNHCDNSTRYVQMFQSFTPSECSRHAVALEKRAIHLVLEEGREIQRMKALNVLGKSAATKNPPWPIPNVKSERL